MKLHWYQKEAHDAVINYFRRSTSRGLIEAATGAGKSYMVAALADTIHNKSGKRILCLQPSKELTEQNHEKYLLTGNKASIFSASLGTFSTRWPVIYGTDKTVFNRIERFKADTAAVIIDEAHGTTPTIRHIVDYLKADNPKLRVLGLTATPYRLGEGYIYSETPEGIILPAEKAANPYYNKLIYRIDAYTLINEGFLTEPLIGRAQAESYSTAHLELDKKGQFRKDDMDRAYHGHGRLTANIVADIVSQSRDRRGVMIFAATVQHAEEVLASLPSTMSAIVTGKTSKKEREDILRDFKAQRLKYLVNVSVLTTGFDASHVDVVALLRATESVGLLQQIIGRGLRRHEGKSDCLVLDYAENLIRHCPDGDVFKPEIKSKVAKEGEANLLVECPSCKSINFTKRRHPEDPYFYDMPADRHGYYIEHVVGEDIVGAGEFSQACAIGTRVKRELKEAEKEIEVPGHYARRCKGLIQYVDGTQDRCEYRWTFKPCLECQAENDIAAKYCASCKAEIVDPNTKLKNEFVRFKKDPYRQHSELIEAWECNPTLTRSGKPCLKISVRTPYRQFQFWAVGYTRLHRVLMRKTEGDPYNNPPKSILYQRNRDSSFYDVKDFNFPLDEEIETWKKLTTAR